MARVALFSDAAIIIFRVYFGVSSSNPFSQHLPREGLVNVVGAPPNGPCLEDTTSFPFDRCYYSTFAYIRFKKNKRNVATPPFTNVNVVVATRAKQCTR